jgi:hypothetical protein
VNHEPESLRRLEEELAENARARIRLWLAGVEGGQLLVLETRAAELRAAIRAASPPPLWDQPDRFGLGDARSSGRTSLKSSRRFLP